VQCSADWMILDDAIVRVQNGVFAFNNCEKLRMGMAALVEGFGRGPIWL